jgi:putative heme-binding domain-containing protein
MSLRTPESLAITMTGALLVASVALVAQQPGGSPDDPYPGSGLTRQQIFDRLTAADHPGRPSVEQGRLLFQALCSNCHLFGDLGQSVGPDLSTVGSRFGKRDLLESILFPSKTISDQYAMVVLTLDDGSTVSGLIALETAQAVFIRTAAQPGGRGVPVLQERIKDRMDATVSMMPEGLAAGLKLEQIDHIVAFMLTGK